jgi:hypothetical protein
MPWQPEDRRPEYSTAAWRRARLACLRAAQWKCQARLDGCVGAASQADHVDGIANDPQHRALRAVCAPCHRRITAQQGGGYRGSGRGDQPADPPPSPRTVW